MLQTHHLQSTTMAVCGMGDGHDDSAVAGNDNGDGHDSASDESYDTEGR